MMGGAKPGTDRKYQAEIRDAAWRGILRSVTDPEMRRADIREEDIIEALIDLVAILVSASEAGKSSGAIRDRVEAIGKKLRLRANEPITKEEAKELFKNVSRAR